MPEELELLCPDDDDDDHADDALDCDELEDDAPTELLDAELRLLLDEDCADDDE